MCKYDVRCDNYWVPDVNGKLRICECFRDDLIKNRYEKSGAPSNNFLRLDELKDQYVLNGKGDRVKYKDVISEFVKNRYNVKELINNESRIVLDGTTGAGKTQFAITLAIEMLATFDLQKEATDKKDEKFGFYFLPTSLLKRIAFNNEEAKEVREKVSRAKILILDDIVSESENLSGRTPFKLDFLNDLIRSFSGVIIMTTNYEGDLKDYYENLQVFYKQKDESEDKKKYDTRRLASVLISSKKEDHGKYNSFFYTIKTGDISGRRKRKNENISFL